MTESLIQEKMTIEDKKDFKYKAACQDSISRLFTRQDPNVKDFISKMLSSDPDFVDKVKDLKNSNPNLFKAILFYEMMNEMIPEIINDTKDFCNNLRSNYNNNDPKKKKEFEISQRDQKKKKLQKFA